MNYDKRKKRKEGGNMEKCGKRFFGCALMAVFTFSVFCGTLAFAEDKDIKIARQYGISYLPLMLMEKNKLIEKHARAAGLGDVTVEWKTLAGGADMNEALLSKSLDFVSGGVAPMIKIWAKTNGQVKALSSINSMPLYMNTTNPNVKTIKDLTDKDRIALPAVKVSIQAVSLQMAAAKAFGDNNYQKLDHLTVTMSHPDGMAAMLSGKSEVTSHFTAPPFQYQELEKPGVHTVVNSYDVLGGPATFNLVWTTVEYRNANPKTYNAVVAAIEEAVNTINKDKRAAAQAYVEIAKSKQPVDEILKMLNDPLIQFTTTPLNTMKYADFMHKVGSIKTKPASWKDMFFPNVHALKGS